MGVTNDQAVDALAGLVELIGVPQIPRFRLAEYVNRYLGEEAIRDHAFAKCPPEPSPELRSFGTACPWGWEHMYHEETKHHCHALIERKGLYGPISLPCGMTREAHLHD